MPNTTAVRTAQVGAAPFFAGKNKIINGDFRINQRNFSTSTNPDSAYNFDRWNGYAGTVGGASAVFSKQTFTPGSAPVAGYEAINYLRIVTTSQDATSSIVFPQQRIEDVRTLAGQTVTISFWAKAASGTPKVFVELSQNFGSGGSPSADVDTGFGQITLSTSWVRYSVTGSVPSISGKTIGTTVNTSFLSFQPWISAGTTYNTRTGSLGAQNNTFEFWGVQIEAGSVATPFTTATGTIQGELAACQRYYYQIGGEYTYQEFGVAQCSSTTVAEAVIPLPVTMRTQPSVTFTSTASQFAARNSTGSEQAGTAVAATRPTTGSFLLRVTVASGLTAGNASTLCANNSTSPRIYISAEL